jgi:hypothetical protein
MQCTKLPDPSSVSQLYDRIRSIVAKPVPIARWETRKDLFYKNLPATLNGLKEPETISRQKYAETLKKSEESAALNVELQEELDNRMKELVETRRAKDSKAVSEIRRKYSSEMEQYNTLIEEARAALKQVPTIVRKALFYERRREEFIPEIDDFDDARRAQEDEQLKKAYASEHGLMPNTDRPKIERAEQTLQRLGRFLEEASPEFAEEIVRVLGDSADLRRKSYWHDMDFF